MYTEIALSPFYLFSLSVPDLFIEIKTIEPEKVALSLEIGETWFLPKGTESESDHFANRNQQGWCWVRRVVGITSGIKGSFWQRRRQTLGKLTVENNICVTVIILRLPHLSNWNVKFIDEVNIGNLKSAVVSLRCRQNRKSCLFRGWLHGIILRHVQHDYFCSFDQSNS